MPTFGHPAQGASVSAPLAADRKNALRTIAPESGVVTALFADLQNLGTEIQALRMGIYADALTMSGASLIDFTDFRLIAPGALRQMVAFDTGISAPVSAGAVYWITLQNGPTGGNAQVWQDVGVGQNADALDSFADGLSTTFGAAGLTANALAVSAQYVPTVSALAGLSQVVLGRKSTSRAGVS